MSKDHNHGEPMSTRVEGVALSALPEFLPIAYEVFHRVADVSFLTIRGHHITLSRTRDGDWIAVGAPYFAAWLDRLGIPWTDDLRRAHEAAGGAPSRVDIEANPRLCLDAPGGGRICVRPRGHELPHGGSLNGVNVNWLPPTHPDARAMDLCGNEPVPGLICELPSGHDTPHRRASGGGILEWGTSRASDARAGGAT